LTCWETSDHSVIDYLFPYLPYIFFQYPLMPRSSFSTDWFDGALFCCADENVERNMWDGRKVVPAGY
jgi:hypothetical protein